MGITFGWLRNYRGEVRGGFSFCIFDKNDTQLVEVSVFPDEIYININPLDIAFFSNKVTLPELIRYH
jgi:hypothetical protein